MPDDALCVSKMNIGLGGKQPQMHNTTIPLDNTFGLSGHIQSLNYPPYLPEDHPYKKFEGQPKGMHAITEEHSHAVDLNGSKRLIGDCMQCKSHNTCKVKCTQPEFKEVNSEESKSKDEDRCTNICCLWHLLSCRRTFKGRSASLN